MALGECESCPGFMINLRKISQCIVKLKRKYPCGIDQLCGMHLVHGHLNLLQHLGVLFQIIFNSGLVPHIFCACVVSPVLQKGKDKNKCSLYRPLTFSPVLCKLLELLIIDEITRVCSMTDNQFGFKKKTTVVNIFTELLQMFC